MGRSGCKKSVTGKAAEKTTKKCKKIVPRKSSCSQPRHSQPSSQPVTQSAIPSQPPSQRDPSQDMRQESIHYTADTPKQGGKKVSCCSFCSLAIAHTFFTLFLQPPIQPHFFHTFHLQLFRTTFFFTISWYTVFTLFSQK